MGRMRRHARPGMFLLSMLASASAAAPDAQQDQRRRPQVELRGDEIRLTGKIDRQMRTAFAALVNSAGGSRVTRLRVDSSGGEMEPGMYIGYWIQNRRLDVTVEHLCASACALYLLPAARRVTFEPGAILAFHYVPGALLREVQLGQLQRGEPVLGAQPGLSRSAYERQEKNAVEMQRGFYEIIGVDLNKMVGTSEIWAESREQLSKLKFLGKVRDAFFIPDRNYIRNCLALKQVDWNDLGVEDSIIYARIGSTPAVLLIKGKLYFEGKLLSAKDHSCVEPLARNQAH